MKKNFLITTGGSGGHVIPASIFYDHLIKVANLTISIDNRGLKYLDKNKYNFKIIDTPKLNNFYFLPINLVKILFLIFKSLSLLKKEKIEKIFSTGGYMSLPLILAARLLRLEIYLIEPNQTIGRTNKYFLSICKKIFCYTKKINRFPDKFQNKIVEIKPLVKENIYKIKELRKENEKFTILIIGGSQGANIFDKNLKNVLVNISKNHSIRIVHQTKEDNISILQNFYLSNNLENNIFSYDRNLSTIMMQADLCITRAGASSLAELSVLSIPFIAVPLPSARDDHQSANANFYKDKDCCWILEQSVFEEKIEEFLKNILKDKRDYLKKKESLKKLNYDNSWINVNQKILININEN